MSGIQRRFCSRVYGLFGKFEDLSMPDTVLGSGNVKANRTFMQYLLNTYRCCVWLLPCGSFLPHKTSQEPNPGLYDGHWERGTEADSRACDRDTDRDWQHQ